VRNVGTESGGKRLAVRPGTGGGARQRRRAGSRAAVSAATVRELKQEQGKDIWMAGGARLAAALVNELDELILKVNPIVLGSGIPLFAEPVGPPAGCDDPTQGLPQRLCTAALSLELRAERLGGGEVAHDPPWPAVLQTEVRSYFEGGPGLSWAMRLFLDFSTMSSDAGASGAAYRLLRRAGHRPIVEYVAVAGRPDALRRLTGHARAPVLITDAGAVIPSLRGIVDWIEGSSHGHVSAPPAVPAGRSSATPATTRTRSRRSRTPTPSARPRR
jgi:hypothetical protein